MPLIAHETTNLTILLRSLAYEIGVSHTCNVTHIEASQLYQARRGHCVHCGLIVMIPLQSCLLNCILPPFRQFEDRTVAFSNIKRDTIMGHFSLAVRHAIATCRTYDCGFN